ncbi:unnamed protein product, partial [Ectocarpus sp. 12 AP-2014]
MYPGGEVQPLWEASLLRSHVHPSVSRFADSLVSKQQNHAVQYKGDPLADLALMPFLNRMAYKNPKARDDKNQGRGMRRVKAPVGEADAAVNDDAFITQPKESVSADQVFFHNFFREKAERDRARGITSASYRKKKAAAAAAAGGGKGARRRQDDEDDPDSSFMVDDVADEADDTAGLGDDDDAEEEAFAMQLAEGLMRDAAAGRGGASGLDDEDPDMDGWSDMDGDDDDDDSDDEGGSKSKGSFKAGGDADDFMEAED